MIKDRKNARIAGVWYLTFIIAGAFSIMFVNDRLTVVGDKLTTLDNFRSNMVLFTIGMLGEFGLVLWLLIKGVKAKEGGK